MSSLISDIFYGSKQNIIDQYLFNRVQKSHPDSSFTPQEDNSNFLKLNVFTKQENLQLKKYQLLLQFEKCERSLLYQVTLQIGKMQISEYIQMDNYGNSQTIEFGQVQYNFIKDHRSIKILLKTGSGVKSKKSFGHIPIQMILQAIQMEASKKSKVPKVTDVVLTGSLSIKKVRIKLKVKEIQVANGLIYQKKKQSLSNQKNNNSASLSNAKSFTQSNNVNIISSDKTFTDKSMNKLIKSQNKIVKICLIFMDYSLNPNIENQQKDVILTISTNLQQQKRSYHKNDKIVVENINENGLIFQVQKQQQKIGIIHLNALVSLSQNINGEFPIINSQGKCLGQIKICSWKANQPNQKYKAELQQTIKEKYKQKTIIKPFEKGVSKKIQQNKTNLTILSFKKILLLINQKNQSNIKKKIQQNAFSCIITRSSSSLHQSKIIIKQLHKNLYELILEDNYIQLQNQTLHQVQDQHLQLPLEIEIYIDKILISYSKVVFKLPLQNHIQIIQGYIDGGTQGYIVQAYHQSWTLSYPTSYFLSFKIKNIVKILISEDFSIQINRQQLGNSIIMSWMKKINKKQSPIQITYIQCQRLLDLLIKNYSQTIQTLNQYSITNSKNGFFSYLQIMQELLYLDPFESGLIQYKQWVKVCNFYSLDSGENWVLRTNEQTNYRDFALNQKLQQWKKQGQNNKQLIPYLFILSGMKLIKKEQIIKQVHKQNQQKHENTFQIKRQNFKQLDIQGQNEQIYVVEIQCKNMHLLMPQNRIPSCYISLNSHRTQYSNANPKFKIGKNIKNNKIINFYHKNIKDNSQINLCNIMLDKNKVKYSITDHVSVHVTFKESKQNITQQK